MEGSLADEQFSMSFAVDWFEGKLARHGSDLILSIMEHNAGRTAVEGWFNSEVSAAGASICARDIESCIETARSVETRSFAREVWLAMAISRAVGMFQGRGLDDSVGKQP